MSSFEDDLLLDAAEDTKALQYIRQQLTAEESEKFTDDLLYYFIDLMVEYYAESGILDAAPDAEGFVDINLNEIALYMAEKAKKEKIGNFEFEELVPVIEHYLDFEENCDAQAD